MTARHALLFSLSVYVGCLKVSPAREPARSPAPTFTVTTKPSALRFGTPIDPNAARVTLDALAAAPLQFTGRAFQVQGQVVAMCQEMGCWMEIRDQATQAHIRIHAHSFFLPRNINGRRASVQATLVPPHPATACDQEAGRVAGTIARVELDATGVEIQD